MSNGYLGGRGSTAKTEKQFDAFDHLPRSVREALRDAQFDWASYPIKRWFDSGRMSAKEIVSAVKKWDRDQHNKDVKRGLVAP